MKTVSTQPIRYLVLLLTNACNLRCAYCYRGEDKNSQALPKATAQKALALAAASGCPFHVQLTGGEPNLEPGLIAFVGDAIRRSHLPATIALQTNGTLIDAMLARLYRRYDIEIGLSIDGPPVIHDAVRGRFKETLNGLEVLAEHNIPCSVTAVVSAVNVDHLFRLALLLACFPNVRGLGLDLLVKKGLACNGNISSPSADQLRLGLEKLLKTLDFVNQRRKIPLLLRELEGIRRRLTTTQIRPFCHACQGESLAVHPDGTVYPCSQTVGDPDFAAGTVDEVLWNKLRLSGELSSSEMQCKDCPVAESCPGDCPSRLHYNAHNKRELMCIIYKTIAEHIKERKSI